MKKSLYSVTVLASLLLASSAALGQMPGGTASGQWGGQPPTVDQRMQRMTQTLELSGDQQEKIKPILEAEAAQMQTLRDDPALSQQDRMAKMKEIREHTASQINPILNPDQQKKYAEMTSRMGRGRGPGQAGAPPQSQPQPQP
jgi:hypothetical protein